jgi:hypothetical protein
MKVKPTKSDRHRMRLRGDRSAIKLTAKTVEEALAGNGKVQYVRNTSKKAEPPTRKKKSSGMPASEGTPKFVGGFRMSQAGLPTLGKRR